MNQHAPPASRFVSGQLVEVLPYGEKTWRNAIVDQPAPYRKAKCDGAYCSYDPLPKYNAITGSPSTGGWFSDKSIRPRPVEELPDKIDRALRMK